MLARGGIDQGTGRLALFLDCRFKRHLCYRVSLISGNTHDRSKNACAGP